MNFTEVKKSSLEDTLNGAAWTIVGAAAFACIVLMIGSCGDLDSSYGSEKTAAWIRIGWGIGILLSGFVFSLLLRSLAEILVLLKASAPAIDSETKEPSKEQVPVTGG